MTRVRRGTSRFACLLIGTAVLVTALTPITVGADSITQTRARIARLSSTLAQEERTSEITANEYDAAKVKLQQINRKITSLDAREVAKRGAIAVTAKKLAVAVVRAYVVGAAEAQILGLFNQDVSTSGARHVYEQQVIGDLTTLENNYQAEKNSLDATIAEVSAQRARAQRQTATIEGLLVANAHNESVTRATLAVVTHKLANEIINYEIAVGVAAARKRDVAGEEQAVAAASEVGGQDAANRVLEAIQAATPPLVKGVAAGSAQGMAALHAAEREIGVPYVWGGESPGHGFDCSGLVQWAWAQAGFSIPRTTQTQYPALHYVPLNALQPGDLLYYYNLDGDHQVDHVVMYAGSGPWGTSTIISAAHSGTNVSYAPLFTFGLVGARRP
ncbi:MAG TPA: NlpC/P60 family protein [Acidimicrobiales bacterium]|nr:NlpC/P60 family protein [Acidimicrobiales bacterium]